MRSTPEPSDHFVIPKQPEKTPPAKPAEVWKPTDSKGIERNAEGQLRTNIPLPPAVFMCHDFGLVDYE